MDLEPVLAELTEVQRLQAMARFAVLRPHLENGVPLPRIAHEAGVALRSVQRCLSRYRAAGLSGLARSPHADVGRRKVNAARRTLVIGAT